MNSTLSILIIISIVIVGYLIYKSKKNKKIGNSSNFISYTYNRPMHNFDSHALSKHITFADVRFKSDKYIIPLNPYTLEPIETIEDYHKIPEN